MLCFGSEGSGLSKEIADLADRNLSIPKGAHLDIFPNSLLDSLNVSVACALLVQEHLNKMNGKK